MDPADFDKALALHTSGRLAEAQAAYQAILKKHPQMAKAHAQLALALFEAGKREQGLRAMDKALRIDPNQPYAWNNRGVALWQLKRYREAIESFDRTLAALPDFAQAHSNRGLCLFHERRLDEALAAIDRALALEPRMGNAHVNRAVVLLEMERPREALAHAERAIALGEVTFEAYINAAGALVRLDRLAEAVGAYDRALALDSQNGNAHFGRATALNYLGRLDEALCAYDRAVSCATPADYALGPRLHAKMMLCDWSGYDQDWRSLVNKANDGKLVSNVFCTLPIPSRPMHQLKLAKLAAPRKYKRVVRAAPAPSERKIKLGYFSSDFHNHATAALIAGMIEGHDRSKFEAVGFSFGPQHQDALRARLDRAFDRMLDISDQGDEQVAALAQSMGIDIAIDLKGVTQDSRVGIFAHGAAPIQVAFLGYPATTGADFIDYMIADPVVSPPEQAQFFTEKMVYLPDSYQANDDKREISSRVYARAELGLPEDGFVFCSFNNNYKITPDLFDTWMRLLQQVDGSVLWLFEGNRWAAENLRKEAHARGIDPARLVFAPKIDIADHLARHRAADLFLDTFYCCAHTTASDALWAGLPVLTKPGETFASRVAASLVSAVGLPELIVPNAEAYEARALELARDRDQLAALKAKLATNRLTAPLFDTARFTRYIEAGYEAMIDRARQGLAPDHIRIAPL